jgi:hypothetical protein
MVEHWYSALASKIGVVIQTDNPDLCIQKLYAARRAAGDPDLDGISIIRAPNSPNELWLLKKVIDNGQAPV